MKKLNIILAIGMMLVMLTSCHTATEMTIFSEPGTEIYTSSFIQLGVTDNSGRLTLKIDNDEYHPFLLSHKPGSKDNIPFALDYQHRKVGGAKTIEGAGWTLIGTGALAAAGGVVAGIATKGDTKTTAWTVAGSGAVLTITGLVMALNGPIDQTAYQYEYKYLPEQRTHQDIHFTQPEFSTGELTVLPTAVPLSEPQEKNPPQQAAASTTVHRTIGQASTKTLKDFGAQLEGTYVGSGKLVKGRETIEEYKGIKVLLKRVSRDVVAVNVEESNGNKYFPKDSNYTIKKKTNGTFTLTMDGITSASITIDAKNKMIYLHPRVNIDGEIYELNINAQKQ